MTADREDGAAGSVTADEAALYDRQIRLWGLDTQNRMRSAHVVIVGLTGTAAEVVKNTVLAGVGSVTVIDDGTIQAADLSACFFFRGDDVGRSRVSDAPLRRIEQLNPLVRVRGTASRAPLASDDAFAALRADVLVATTGWRADLIAWNARCRASGAAFFAASTQGLSGYMFTDLGADYAYITQRPAPPQDGAAGAKRQVRHRQAFVPLDASLSVTWGDSGTRAVGSQGLPRGPRLRQPSAGLFATWALWELHARLLAGTAALAEGNERIPRLAADLNEVTAALLREKSVDPSLVFERQHVDRGQFFLGFARACVGALDGGECAAFAPTCAVLGGLLAQDLLNALGHREEPLVNWCVLDAGRGVAPIFSVGAPSPREE
ncbi:E1 ubiquitin-activating enzyme [Malassezia sp. CBS 17886]|nr:E1 ubiquitin-activating enzyme [Malassezia sp. CBS 17886]